MKKYGYIVAFVFFFHGAAQAQFKRGGFLAGGSMGGSYGQTEYRYGPQIPVVKANSLQLAFTPQVGYFVIDNLAVGLSVTTALDNEKEKTTDDKTNMYTFTAGPFVRYYYKRFFASAGWSPGKGTTYQRYGGYVSSTTYTLQNTTFGVGYALMLNDFVAIEPSVVYSINKTTNKEFSDYHTDDGHFLLNVGLQFYLHK